VRWADGVPSFAKAELSKFRLDQKAEMQAGRGRPGFDVTWGVV